MKETEPRLVRVWLDGWYIKKLVESGRKWARVQDVTLSRRKAKGMVGENAELSEMYYRVRRVLVTDIEEVE